MIAADLNKVRGIANFNPGNIDRHEPPWNGEIRDTKDPRLSAQQLWELQHGRFAVFSADHWGIRALALNIQAHGRVGHNTIDKLISAWAPSADNNNTAAYIASVCKYTGFAPDAVLDYADWSTLQKIVVAIIIQENGGNPYDAHDIEEGLRLAGVVKSVSIGTSNTAKGGALATGGTVSAAGIDEVRQQMQEAITQLQAAEHLGHLLNYVLIGLNIVSVVVIFVGIGMMLRERYRREHQDNKLANAALPLEHFDVVPAGGNAR